MTTIEFDKAIRKAFDADTKVCDPTEGMTAAQIFKFNEALMQAWKNLYYKNKNNGR